MSPPNDPELARLRAQIDDLETKLALYRRREQLDREYANCLTKEILRERVAPIVQHVCTEFSVSVFAFWKGPRNEGNAWPRHVARYLAKLHFATLSLHQLGYAFAIDHACVHNSIHAAKNRCDTDPAFAARMTKLQTQIAALAAK